MIFTKNFSSCLTIDMKGSALVNNLINKTPIEIHIPGYSYCGPGTKLEKRLKQGDKAINDLDEACKSHDKAYAQNKDLNSRNLADTVLAEKAWTRVKAKNSSIGEKVAAYTVANIMKAKSKLGMGVTNKKQKKIENTSKKNYSSSKKKYKDWKEKWNDNFRRCFNWCKIRLESAWR